MLKIGHRGAPGQPRFGENTITSFWKAIYKGANAVELDVRRAQCGELVVIHDATVNRTTLGKGRVCDLSYKELGQFDAGHGERIPALRDVLSIFGNEVIIDIELKETGLSQDIKKLIIEFSLSDRVFVTAFDRGDTQEDSNCSWDDLSAFVPKIKIGVLASYQKVKSMGPLAYIEEARKREAEIILPHYSTLTDSSFSLSKERFIIEAHRRGLLVYTWNVNDPAIIAKVRALGVDGIGSDCPELL